MTALSRTVRYHLADRVGLLKPRKLRLAVTSRCNARCSMCDAWQKPLARELSIADYESVLNHSASFLSGIRHVSFTGGEPTLREDLVDVVSLITQRLPSASINVNTNGLLPDRIEQRTREVLSFRDQLVMIVSLDGIGKLHDAIRGVPGAFERANSSIEVLLRIKRGLVHPKRLKVEVNYTATDANYQEYETVLGYCEERGIGLNLIVPMSGIIYRKDAEEPALGSQEAAELAAVIRRQLAEEYDLKRAVILDVLDGPGRQFDCWAGRLIVFIDADGAVYPNSSCPARFRMGSIFDDGYDWGNIFKSEVGRDITRQASKCRECQVACETGTTLRLPEAWYAHRRRSRRC